MRRLISFALVLICGVGWLSLATEVVTEKKEYSDTLQQAYTYAEKGLPYPSAQYFVKALGENLDQDIYKQYLVQLYNLNSNEIYYDTLDIYLNSYPEDVDAYKVLLNWYDTNEFVDNYMELYQRAENYGVATEEMTARYKEMYYSVFVVLGGLQDAKSFVGDYATTKQEGHWGIINAGGQAVAEYKYDSIGIMLGNIYPVSLNGEAYFLGINGEKMIAASKPVDELSIISDGCCVARKGDKYALCDTAISVPDNFDYDFLSISSNNVLAAKKGNKWALISSSGTQITDYIYENILIDADLGSCIRNGVIFAKKNGKYIMLDAEGKQIGNEEFDDAKGFAGPQPAAVKIGDKWGFVNSDGTLNGSVKYDEVGSFSMGLYAAKENGKWGYKEPSGDFVIQPEYDECRPFAANGIALVRIGDVWEYITIKGFRE